LIEKDADLMSSVINPYCIPEMITFLNNNEMRINPMALIADDILPFNIQRHEIKFRVDNDL
jgi:hypothetical protein